MDQLGLGKQMAQRKAPGQQQMMAPQQMPGMRFIQPISDCEFTINAALDELLRDAFPRLSEHRPTRCTGTAVQVRAHQRLHILLFSCSFIRLQCLDTGSREASQPVLGHGEGAACGAARGEGAADGGGMCAQVAACLTGAALPAGSCAARVMLFVGGPSTEGAGKVVDKELSEPIRSHEVPLVTRASPSIKVFSQSMQADICAETLAVKSGALHYVQLGPLHGL